MIKSIVAYLNYGHMHACCQGMTCFLLQKHLGVLSTLTSDIFGILQTLTASQFQRHFGVLPIPSLFQQSPTLPCTLGMHQKHVVFYQSVFHQ